MSRAIAAMFLLLASCGDDAAGAPDRSEARFRGTATLGGDVVATVDGDPIDLATVMRAAGSAGITPELALSRLTDEALLAREAERHALGQDIAVRRAVRQAAVQALLAREVESAIGPETIDRASLEARYEAAPERFARPERRRSAYVLASVPDDASDSVAAAAERWIRATHAELAVAPDAEGALLALRRRTPRGEPFTVTVEEVPPLAADDDADPAYRDAIFASAGTGLLPSPVRTALGWHVVVVTEITPAWRATREEALETLAREELARRRAERLEALIADLAARAGVTLDRAGLARLASYELGAER